MHWLIDCTLQNSLGSVHAVGRGANNVALMDFSTLHRINYTCNESPDWNEGINSRITRNAHRIALLR